MSKQVEVHFFNENVYLLQPAPTLINGATSERHQVAGDSKDSDTTTMQQANDIQVGDDSNDSDVTQTTKKFDIETFKHPGVPPVCNLRRSSDKEYVPLLVFGFPITNHDKDDFAGRAHLIPRLSPNVPYDVKREEAFVQLMRQIPRKYKRYTPMLYLVEFNGKPVLCVVLGTNQTEEDLDVTLNMTMIEKVHEILQTYYPPQWFVLGG